MVKKYGVILGLLIAMFASYAQAYPNQQINCSQWGCYNVVKPHTYRGHGTPRWRTNKYINKHQHVRSTYHKRAYVHNSQYRGMQDVSQRPADCVGIPWCGCWLRHQLGLADKSLNLAAAWLRRGHIVSADAANVVLWPGHHHVGLVLRVHAGKALVRSGNSGRGGVTERWITTSGRYVFLHV